MGFIRLLARRRSRQRARTLARRGGSTDAAGRLRGGGLTKINTRAAWRPKVRRKTASGQRARFHDRANLRACPARPPAVDRSRACGSRRPCRTTRPDSGGCRALPSARRLRGLAAANRAARNTLHRDHERTQVRRRVRSGGRQRQDAAGRHRRQPVRDDAGLDHVSCSAPRARRAARRRAGEPREREQDGVSVTPRLRMRVVRELPPRNDETLSYECTSVEETPR